MIESHDLCQMMANENYHKINGVNRTQFTANRIGIYVNALSLFLN